MRKKRYNSSLKNCKQKKSLKIIDEKKIKYIFNLVVKLIINKYHVDLFRHLSYLLIVIPNRLVDFT